MNAEKKSEGGLMRTVPLFVRSLILAMCLFSQWGFGDPASPEPGGSCSDPGEKYYYSTDVVKSPWSLDQLYALPLGAHEPESWEMKSAFQTQFLNALGGGSTPHAYAEACAGVWTGFFSADANVVVTTMRTVTAKQIELECQSGQWVRVSTQDKVFNDVSDWLEAGGNPFNVTDPESMGRLDTALQRVLFNLNSQ